MSEKAPSQHQANVSGLPQDACDWNGKDDPDNPRNFSIQRKIASTAAYTGLAFVSTFAASLYSAGTQGVKNEFGCSEEVAILPLALYN